MNGKLFYTIITNFRSSYDLGKQFGKYDEYTDEVFYDILDNIIKMYDWRLNQSDILEMKKHIDSEFQIYQEDGTALIDDYDHMSEWYSQSKDNITQFFWNRYRKHLFDNGWATNVIEKLDYNTLDTLMNFLGDPNKKENFHRKGLVMGDVQSGKTSNYIGLICKAADAGYKVIILLTGVLESLRRQTQIRVEEGFIGYDVDSRRWVGVGINSDENAIIPKSVTSRVNDFTGVKGENTFLRFKNEENPFIFITKKNSKTLKKIRESITNINLKAPLKEINTSLLIIDDEADNASINTNTADYDPTKINAEIRKLLNLFSKSNYVGFTATPFANVFIDPDSETEMLKGDLFPEHFIYSLNPPSNYFGSVKIFEDQTYDTVQIINDYTYDFPLKHKKDWQGDCIFDSLIEAVNAFLIINAIRDLGEGDRRNSHRSMLINVSRFIQVQERIEFLVNQKYENIYNAIRHTSGMSIEEALSNQYIRNLQDVYLKHYNENYSWKDIFHTLYNSIKDIKIYKVPFKDKKKRLNYDEHKERGLRVIVIGGLALSRGLTLEGLTISYLYRNTSTFDVLMQMGRWFGYRDKPKNYENLCKVWMLEQTREYFQEITRSIKELKTDFEQLVLSKKSPREFGIRVRNESDKLGITGRSKMRTSKRYVYTYDLFGQVLETPFIHAQQTYITHNQNLIVDFVSRNFFQEVEGSLFAENVPANKIIELLEQLHIHEANRLNYFEKDKIIDVIKKYHFDQFDVVLLKGNGKMHRLDNNDIHLIERSFDTINLDTLRISGVHRRLGGTFDTRYGLNEDIRKELIKDGKVSNATFLIEGRKPIFMIYPLQLKKVEDRNKIKHTLEEFIYINKIVDLFDRKKLVPVGIGIGFPKDSKNIEKETKVFFINESTNWWEVMKEKDDEEDV